MKTKIVFAFILVSFFFLSCEKENQPLDATVLEKQKKSNVQGTEGGQKFSVKEFIKEFQQRKDSSFSMQPLFTALNKMDKAQAEKTILEFNTGQGESADQPSAEIGHIVNGKIGSIAGSKSLATENQLGIKQMGTLDATDPVPDPASIQYPQKEEIILSGIEIWTDDTYNYDADNSNGGMYPDFQPIELERTSSHKYTVARHTFNWFQLNSRVSITKKWSEKNVPTGTSPKWKIIRIANEDIFLEGYHPFTTWFPANNYPQYEIGYSYDGQQGGDWASETVRGMLDNRLTAEYEWLKKASAFLPWNREVFHTQIFH